MLINPIWFYIF